MQPNGMIFWDWNGTLMDDVDFTHSCLNWMLETHGYPQRYDLAAYRELFGFPIEDYYRCAGFDFARHPYPELAARFMEHYNAGVPGCAVTAHAVDTLQTLARMGWQQAVLSASRRDYLIEQVSARGLQGFFTELLGLADIYGVSKVQLGTDYLRRNGGNRRPYRPIHRHRPGGLCDGRRHRPRCRSGCGHRCNLCAVHRRASVPRPAGKGQSLRHRRPCPAARTAGNDMISVAQKRLSVFLSHLFLQPVRAQKQKKTSTQMCTGLFGRSSGI